MAILLTWDDTAERFYETGVDHGVFYAQDSNGDYPLGVAWNGLISVSESPQGGEANAMWADNIKYNNLLSAEEFEGSIEAFTYPDEFALVDGSELAVGGTRLWQQSRGAFGLCYRTIIGNDVDLDDHAFLLHLLYGLTVSPSEKSYETKDDSPEGIAFSWDFSSVPAPVTGSKPTSLITIDSRTADATKLTAFLEIIYGDDTPTDPRLPLPDEVVTLMTP